MNIYLINNLCNTIGFIVRSDARVVVLLLRLYLVCAAWSAVFMGSCWKKAPYHVETKVPVQNLETPHIPQDLDRRALDKGEEVFHLPARLSPTVP